MNLTSLRCYFRVAAALLAIGPAIALAADRHPAEAELKTRSLFDGNTLNGWLLLSRLISITQHAVPDSRDWAPPARMAVMANLSWRNHGSC